MVALERAGELDRAARAASTHAPTLVAPGHAAGRASYRLVALATVVSVAAVELAWLGLLLFLLVRLVQLIRA